jgi:hypothetical protein
VVWANGFRYDFDWVHLPVFAETGDPPRREPIHRRGLTDIPGLYFIACRGSAQILTDAGAGEDAAFCRLYCRSGYPILKTEAEFPDSLTAHTVVWRWHQAVARLLNEQ